MKLLFLMFFVFFCSVSFIHSSKFIGNSKDGWGSMFFDNGDFYTGSWKGGKKDGRGVYVWYASGSKYVGEWKAGTMEGWGVMYSKDATIGQIGFYKAGKIDETVPTNKMSSEEGTVCGNAADGYAIYSFKGGNKYDGSWKGPVMEGGGVYLFRTGEFAYGIFSAGRLNGSGVYFWDKETVYIGNFRSGVKEGQGTLYGTGGKVIYSGNWKDGKQSDVRSVSASSAPAKVDQEELSEAMLGIGNDHDNVESITTNLVSTNLNYTNDLAYTAYFTMLMMALLETSWPGVFEPGAGQVNDFSVRRVWDDRSLYLITGKYRGRDINLSVKSLWADKSEYVIGGTYGGQRIDLDWRDVYRNVTEFTLKGKFGAVPVDMKFKSFNREYSHLFFSGTVGRTDLDFDIKTRTHFSSVTSVFLRGKAGENDLYLDAQIIPDREDAKMFSIKGSVGETKINMRLTDTWGEGSNVKVQ